MTIKGKHILTSVALLPEEHAFLAARAGASGSMSAVVREAIRLLMRENSEKATSKKQSDCEAVA